MTKKSYAKVNIFLKIAGIRGSYHELVSRFVRVHSLYDLISFEKTFAKKFKLIGKFSCQMQNNTVYKAYKELEKLSAKVKEYFNTYSVKIEKNIPEFAGLGGGSSNAATFLIMTNQILNLGLNKDELAAIGTKIGADVPFFIYEYDSANVTGIGEIVKKFDEEILNIKTFTPDIKCDTSMIYKKFRENYYKEISEDTANRLMNMKSKDILNELSIEEANDLYLPAVSLYPELDIQHSTFSNQHYFSGSGSSFFRIINE